MYFCSYCNLYMPVSIYLYIQCYNVQFTLYSLLFSKCTSLFLIPFVYNYKLCTAESQGQRAEKKVTYYVRINIQSTNSNLLSDLYIPEAIPKCFNNMKHVL